MLSYGEKGLISFDFCCPPPHPPRCSPLRSPPACLPPTRACVHACTQRLLSKFSPLGWSKWRWQAFSSLKRTAQVFSMIAATMLLELNAFMVMNALEVKNV